MKRKPISIILCLILAAAAIFSLYKVVTILIDYKTGVDTYDELQQYIYIDTSDRVNVSQPTDPSDEQAESSSGEETEIVWPTVDFEALQAINEDVVGWIYIEGTRVNYPIVQGPDNNYYLRRMIDGTYNTAGSIFMDARNHDGFSDANTILYGHNMNNGSMFADILGYKEQAYYDAHPVCLILTPDKKYTLEFFTGYVTAPEEDAWQRSFGSDAEFERWLQSSAAKSYFDTDVIPTASDHIVTLSTCSYEFNNARFVLVGVLRPAA